MKKVNALFVLLAIAIAATFSACSDGGGGGNNNSNSAPTPNLPGNPVSIMAAVVNLTTTDAPVVGPITVEVDAATGVINDGSSNLDMGDLTVNGNDMNKTQNTYAAVAGSGGFTGGSTDLGFGTSSTVDWVATGGAGVPAWSYTTTNRGVGQFSLNGDYSTVDKSADLTVTISTFPTNADELFFYIIGGNNTLVTKTVTSGTSATFTASDLSALGNTNNGFVGVVGYNYENATVGGFDTYFINETVRSTTCKVQ